MKIKILLKNKSFPYLSCNVYYLYFKGKHIIIDTGVQFLRKHIINALAEIDLTPEHIDIVINTHLHFDHCGNNEIFTNAVFYVPEKEIEYLSKLQFMDKKEALEYLRTIYPLVSENKIKNLSRMIMANFNCIEWLLENQYKVVLLKEGDYCNELFYVEPSYGHCPGHVCVVFEDNKKQLCFSGDLFDRNFFNNMRPDKSKEEFINFKLEETDNYVISNCEQLEKSRRRILGLYDCFFLGHGNSYFFNNEDNIYELETVNSDDKI